MNLYATFVHRRSPVQTFRGRTEWRHSRLMRQRWRLRFGDMASRLSESEHIGTLNHTIPNGSALPQSHWPSHKTLCK